MLTIKNSLLKSKTAKDRKITVHLEIGHAPLPTTNVVRKGKNIAVALDISGSMDESIKRIDYMERYRQAAPQPIHQPINPINPWKPAPAPAQPHWPTVPFNPPVPTAPQFPPPWNPNNPGPYFLGQAQPIADAQVLGNIAIAAATPTPPVEVITKIMLAKKALLAAIDALDENDTLSIVLFNNSTQTLAKNVVMNETNKVALRQKVEHLQAMGGTNLHLGWLDAMGCVSEVFDATKINRVMLLTDGQTNSGLQDQAQICAQVANFLDKGISTTTFGIGEGFNEVLLQAISEAGGGDFHYIEDDKTFDELFSQELNNVAATVANQIVLGMGPQTQIVSAVNLQEFVSKPLGYLLPNLIRNKKIQATVELTHNAQEGDSVSIPFVVSYTDLQGQTQYLTHNINVECVSPEEEAALPENKEVLTQLYKVQTAQTTKNAGLFAAQGARGQAKAAIEAQINALQGFDKNLMQQEIGSLQSALASCVDMTVSNSSSAKMLRSQSYDTRYSKF